MAMPAPAGDSPWAFGSTRASPRDWAHVSTPWVKQRATFDADSDTHVILARPFYNLTLDTPDADLVVFPTSRRVAFR